MTCKIQETSKKDFSAVRTYLRKYFNPNRENKTLPRRLSHFLCQGLKRCEANIVILELKLSTGKFNFPVKMNYSQKDMGEN